MGYAWSETIDQAVEIDNNQAEEIRTNINTERTTRAGLGAYDWIVDDLDGTEILQTEIQELRTAIDEAYDLLWECVSHYTTDDSTHYSSNDSSHDSADDASHYSTDDSSDDTSVDAADYAAHNADHDSTHYATHYSTDKSGYVSSRKTSYNIVKCASYYKLDKEYKKLLRGGI